MTMEERKKLLTEIIEADAKDGLYHIGDTNKMMTAVEWLIHQLNTRQKPLDNSQIDELFEQAKTMEKEQIINAHGIKLFAGKKDGWDSFMEKTGEQYYNETYNK